MDTVLLLADLRQEKGRAGHLFLQGIRSLALKSVISRETVPTG